MECRSRKSVYIGQARRIFIRVRNRQDHILLCRYAAKESSLSCAPGQPSFEPAPSRQPAKVPASTLRTFTYPVFSYNARIAVPQPRRRSSAPAIRQAARPEEGRLSPNGNALSRDGNFLSPDGNLPSPDRNFLSPDTNSLSPDGNLLSLDRNFPSPDANLLSPDGNFPSPDANSLSRDGNLLSPDANFLSPDGNLLSPDGTGLRPAAWRRSHYRTTIFTPYYSPTN
jgi:hypothetical protein